MDNHFSFWRHPKWQIIIVIVLGTLLYAYLTYRLGGPQENFWPILIDLALFYLGIVFWMFFFSQFILPVNNFYKRRKAFGRLWNYLFGTHGPVIFIENGEILKHAGEMDRAARGIFLLDTASAAVLRTDVEYTRAVGPGIIFNEVNPTSGLLDEIREGFTVDLHRQSQFFGPREDENPFEKAGNEAPAAYSERQKRRWQTSGRTRNGFEIVPNVIVAFQLDVIPGEGHTQFGYNEAPVFRALTSGGIDPDLASDSPRKNVSWNELPGFLAADVWRETAAMFTFDELFQDLPAEIVLPGTTDRTSRSPRKPSTGLEFINTYLRQRLTQSEVDMLDGSGHVIGKMPSQEYKQLKERGIKVNGAFVVNLRFEDAVEEELIRRWKSTWKQRAQAERGKIDEEMDKCRIVGQERAMQEYSQAASQSLSKLSPGIARDSTTILTELVEGTLGLVVRNPRWNNTMSDEKNILLDLINWLQKRP